MFGQGLEQFHRARLAQLLRSAGEVVVHIAVAVGQLRQQFGGAAEVRVDVVTIIFLLFLQLVQFLLQLAIAARFGMQITMQQIADHAAGGERDDGDEPDFTRTMHKASW